MFNKKLKQEIKELKAYIKIKEHQIKRLEREIPKKKYDSDEIMSMFAGEFGIDFIADEAIGYYYWADDIYAGLVYKDEILIIDERTNSFSTIFTAVFEEEVLKATGL